MLNKLKIIFIYILGFIGTGIGRFLTFFRGNNFYNKESLNTIFFNRSDRIGDAIISKPFIELTISFLNKRIKVEKFFVITSKYNSFVFENSNFNVIKEDKKIEDDYNLLKMMLGTILLFCKNVFRRKVTDQNDLIIDLVGDPYLLTKYKRKAIGPNLFLNNLLLDFSLKNSYVSLKSINLIESYINLIEGYFNFKGEFRDYIYNNLNYFVSGNKNFNNDILVFIGNKEYRNLTIEKWIELIKELSIKIKGRKIYIIDDNTNFIFNRIKDFGFNKNIKILKNNFSLEEFKNFAKKFYLLIGIDGGGFNFIRNMTNSITIYTLGNFNVWSLFLGNIEGKVKNLGNNYYFVSKKYKNNTFSYVYKKDLFLPSYDVSLGNNYFNDLNIINFIDSIKKIYKT